MSANLDLRRDVLTRKETAVRLGVSEKTVDRLADAGILKRLRQGEKWVRFRVDDVERYIQSMLDKAEEKSPDNN